MGIEPTYSAWEADILPMNYTRISTIILAQSRSAVKSFSAKIAQKQCLQTGDIFYHPACPYLFQFDLSL